MFNSKSADQPWDLAQYLRTKPHPAGIRATQLRAKQRLKLLKAVGCIIPKHWFPKVGMSRRCATGSFLPSHPLVHGYHNITWFQHSNSWNNQTWQWKIQDLIPCLNSNGTWMVMKSWNYWHFHAIITSSGRQLDAVGGHVPGDKSASGEVLAPGNISGCHGGNYSPWSIWYKIGKPTLFPGSYGIVWSY